jgi:hypothetical protein
MAEIIRMIPRPILSRDAEIVPTNKPPISAPITEPIPIGATVYVQEQRDSERPEADSDGTMHTLLDARRNHARRQATAIIEAICI